MHVYLKDFDYNGSKVIAINTSIRDFGNSKVIRKTSKPENKTKCCTPIMHSKPNEHCKKFILLDYWCFFIDKGVSLLSNCYL